MKSITELVDVPEEEYSLYLQEHKDNGVAYGSDSARDANFRYETESRQEPKQNFFGKVKNPFPETNYLGAAARGFGRTLVNVVPDLARGLTRAWQEGITERLQKYSGQMDIARLDVEMRELEKRNNFDNMTVEQKRDFYKNNTEYNKLASQLDEAYDKMIMLESPEYKKQVDEIYGNLKKTQQQFVENIGLGAKPEDAKIITELAEGAGSLVEALGITFITKNPMAAGAVFGAQQGAGLYEELREKGVDVDKSLVIAGAGGVAEGALEYKGLDKLIENMTAKTFGKSVAKSFAIESIQEGSQQAAEEVLMAKYRQDEEFKDKALRVGKSMLYGGVLGSAATVVSRPFLMRYANDVKDTLVQNGVDEQRANELTSDAVYGTPQEQEKASHEIQVAIGSAQFSQMGFSPDESEQLAETFAMTQEEIQNEVLDSANAEIDPETYEGGTIASGAKFFDENLKKDYIAEDFDIQEAVQEEAEKNHLPKEEAELAGKLVESFARVMYNKTGQTPKEFWESGGKLMIRDQRVSEMEDIDESELTPEEMDVADDGSYVGDDGLLHAKDGTVLFQGAKDVAQRINEIDAEEAKNGVPEYTAPTININGVERQTTNSNGDPIAKSEKSLKYFYNWFGDSKVVDEQGRPLVVYHGTNYGQNVVKSFKDINVRQEFVGYGVVEEKTENSVVIGGKTYSALRAEILANQEQLVEKITDKPIDVFDKKYLGRNTGVKLSKLGFFFSELEEYTKPYGKVSFPVYLKLENPLMVNAEGQQVKSDEFYKTIKKQLKGNDGVVIYNILGEKSGREYVAFESNQIKSIDNRGTFSGSPDIYYQSAFAGSRVDYDRPSLEKIGSGEGNQAHGWGLYYALNRNVAEGYRERFALYGDIELNGKTYSYDSPEAFIYRSYKDGTATVEELVDYAKLMMRFYSNDKNSSGYKKAKIQYDFLIKNGDKLSETKQKKGQLHEVDIPESPYLLDEQKKYDEQSDIVKEAIDNIFNYIPDNFKSKSRYLKEYKNVDGRSLYLKISDIAYFNKYGKPATTKEAFKLGSELLHKNGVKGITYYGRKDGRCFVIFNPDDVKVIQKFYQGEKEQPRASYTQGAYEKIIDIFKTGDKSSIVHELGHYFTMNYIDLLTKYNQLDEVADVLNWLGVNSVDELREEHWEKFARGFETYVMEGVSPNQKVASLFERFKQWLIQVYKDFVPEEINDDVRAFFDKMLASEEEFNYEEIMRLGNDMQSLREVMKNALAGKEVQIGGMNIADVKKLMNVLSTRIPRKPKTLVELFKDVGINEAFAKRFDLDALLGVKDLIQDEEVLKQLKKRGLITQKQINQARKLITKQGGISSEDEMIDFLSGLGLLTNVSDTYEGTSATWDEALNLIENAENIFRPQDIEQAEKREQILDAIEVAEKSLQGIGKYEDVVKAVKALAKENIVSVQKETLKYIKNKQKELQKDYNALLRKMLKAQKKDLQFVRDAVVDYIKGQPISGDDKVKLLGFIKKANSLNSLQKVSESIKNKAMEYYDNEQRKMLNKEIQRELKKTRPTSMTEQRYDYENNKLFVDLRNYNKLTKEKASEELAKLPMDEESISNLSEIDLIKRRFLSYKAGGADASAELLEQVLTDIVNAKEKGKLAKNEQEHEKMLKQEEDRQELLTILDEKKADPKSLSSKLQSIYRRGFTSLYSLIDSIFGKDIADKYQMEVKQTDVNSKIYFKSSEVINNSARIFGVKGRNGLLNLFADMASKKYTITNSEGVNKEIDAFAIIDIYNAIKNEKTKNDYYEAFGEEQVNGLVNTLTVQQRAFGDYLMQEVNSYYDKLNKVYVKLYGIDLPRVDNYWMATSEHRDAIDIQGDYFQQTTIPSALKERARGRVVPIPKNAWEKFNKHIAEAEYISGLGLDYMNVKKIFKSNRVKGKIIEKYGEGIYKDIMNDIESLSMASKIQEIDAVTGLFQKILNNFVTAKIAIGIPVFVKQLTSCTNYAVDMPIAKWAAGFAEGLLHPRKTAKYMMDNAPFLKARFGQGYNEAVERVIREAQKHSGKKVRWIEAMSSFTRLGDIGAIIYGGYPYLKYLQESGDKDAVQKFEFATLRSQQAGTPVSLSPFQRQRGMMRVFQAFNNTPTQYMRMLADAVYQYTNGDITATKFAKQMFNFGLVQPILYVLAGTMAMSMIGSGDDDDDVIMDIVRQILLNPIDAIPVFSDLAGALFDKMAGQKNYGLRPVLVQDIDKLMQKLNKDEYDAWDAADIITPIIEGISGAPAGRAVRILKTNFKD